MFPVGTHTIAGAQRTRSLMAATIFLVAGLLAVVVPFVQHTVVFACAAAMLFCLIAPNWQRAQHGAFDAFETINIVGVLHFAFFGLGGIWAVTDPSVTTYDNYLEAFIPRAAFYALLGYVALMLGYFGPRRTARTRPRVELYPRGVLALLIPGTLGFVGAMASAVWAWAFWMGVRVSGLFSSLAQLKPLFLYTWALGWLMVFSGKATPGQRKLVWFGLVPAAAILISSDLGSKYHAMSIAGLPLIAYWYARRRLPWRVVVALLLVLIFVLFPFYNTFRAFDPRFPMTERLELTSKIIGSWDGQEYLDRSVGTFKSRMALINQFAVVLRDVPRWVPYAKGDTLFMPAIYYFIPRAVWKDKPDFLFGREFGVTFRVVSALDDKTSIASTIPGELFWNYDLPGVLVGMGLLGFALRLLYRRYGSTAGFDPVRRAIHIVLLSWVALLGAGLAGQTVQIVKLIVVLEIIVLLGRRYGLVSAHPVEAARG